MHFSKPRKIRACAHWSQAWQEGGVIQDEISIVIFPNACPTKKRNQLSWRRVCASVRMFLFVAEALEGLEEGNKIGGLGGFVDDGVDAGIEEARGFAVMRGAGPDEYDHLL